MIEDTGYAIPSLIEEDQSCLDILESAIQQTLLNTGRLFVLYDDGSGVSLRECANLISNVILGTQSLLTEYTYKTDIDDQVYNSVKLARPNEETGRSVCLYRTGQLPYRALGAAAALPESRRGIE